MTSGVSVGIKSNLSENLELENYLAYQKEAFIQSLSTNLFSINIVSTPEVGTKLSYNMFKLLPFTLGIQGVTVVTLPTKTQGFYTRMGGIYGGSFYLKQSNSEGSFFGDFKTSIGILQRNQNISIIQQTETDAILSVQFHLGKNSKK